MDNQKIEEIWTGMRKYLEWMKVTLEPLSDDDMAVLKTRADEWFLANPLESE